MKLAIFALAVAAASANTLFFSEYIESISYRKALEIYNPTGSDVDGSTVTLQFHANGNDKSGSSSYSEDLAGHTLSAGATLTICRGGSKGTTFEDENVAACDMFMSSNRMKFNGNDEIELQVNGAIVDVIGDGDLNFGENKGLRRIATVQTGSTAYDDSQWLVFDDEDLAGLGSHTAVQPWVGNTLFVSEYIEGSGNLKAFEIFNPSTTDVSASRISYEIVLNGGSSTKENTLHASYTLPAGGTITVCHTDFVGAGCDLYDGKVQFNGNDALKLYVDGALVDVVGVPDSNSNDIKDTTLRRKPSVHTGSLTYDASQWTSEAKDVIDGLQTHAIVTTAAPTTTTTTTSASLAKGGAIGEDSFFATGEAPHCFVDPTTGRTVIHTDLSAHTSFSCQHNSGTCTCVAHSTAGCKELTHTSGQTIQVSAQGTC